MRVYFKNISFEAFTDKDIGIYRFMGARHIDIIKIYLFEGFVIAATAFIGGLGRAFYAFCIRRFSEKFDPSLQMLQLNFGTILTLLCASFVVIFLACLIPLLKMKKTKPVDLILHF